jgi:hypothetical protein
VYVSFFFLPQTHVCLVSARSNGPDQADSPSTIYLSHVIHRSHAACSGGMYIWTLDSCHLSMEPWGVRFQDSPDQGISFSTLPTCWGVVGSGSPSVRPHCWAAVGNGTPSTHCHIAWEQRALGLLQDNATLLGSKWAVHLLQHTAIVLGSSGTASAHYPLAYGRHASRSVRSDHLQPMAWICS